MSEKSSSFFLLFFNLTCFFSRRGFHEFLYYQFIDNIKFSHMLYYIAVFFFNLLQRNSNFAYLNYSLFIPKNSAMHIISSIMNRRRCMNFVILPTNKEKTNNGNCWNSIHFFNKWWLSEIAKGNLDVETFIHLTSNNNSMHTPNSISPQNIVWSLLSSSQLH